MLTRLPAGTMVGKPPSIADSAWSWPLVGATIGSISAAVWWGGLGLGLSPLLAAVVAILVGVLATGALHEDGLADLADGFGGGRDKARVLEIMRDSQIGSYGALALVFSVILRVAALSMLGGCEGALALIGLSASSRAALPLALRLMPAVRADGLGSAASGVSLFSCQVSVVSGFVALLPLGIQTALVVSLSMASASVLLAAWAKTRIGGQTGDVLGAICQLGEIAGWIVVAGLLHSA